MFIAHTKNSAGQRQDLAEHLRAVADHASLSGSAFDAREFLWIAGLLHDIGKYHSDFQQYMLEAEKFPQKQTRGPDHKQAGSLFADTRIAQPASLLVSCLVRGHHGGLPALADQQLYIKELKSLARNQHAVEIAFRFLPELSSLPSSLLPAFVKDPLHAEMFVRMAFSALVDADCLDTEQHFELVRSAERQNSWSIEKLWTAYQSEHQRQFQAIDQRQAMQKLRAEVHAACLEAALLPPGFFRLTVPTGGGKTLSSLGFALRHAFHHDLRRVIYAIPYTSIIEQTGQVFSRIFHDSSSFIEHHSNVVEVDPDNPTLTERWQRLASENWDASLIVTTTIQLFESLLGRRTSACRKLHRIAKSVIVLDEIQMLPTSVLSTIMDVLNQLVASYGVSVVLCTATQPDFDTRTRFQGFSSIREIVPDPQHLFSQLQRVAYSFPSFQETWSWSQVAEQMRSEKQSLVVVNTRKDALALYDQLRMDEDVEEQVFHLSTRLCGSHRRAVLQEIQRRLHENEPCYLIATQVVEAGVDLDFPLVLRAFGPLERIVQAAGRANREGLLHKDGKPVLGRVIVFEPEAGRFPKGAHSYKLGSDITRNIFAGGVPDLHDPRLFQRYFREYYFSSNLDRFQVETMRKALNYPEVEKRFRIIDDQTTPVIVNYHQSQQEQDIEQLISTIRSSRVFSRQLQRRLQPFLVNLFSYELALAKKHHYVDEIREGVWQWTGGYDGALNGKGILFDVAFSVEDCIW